MQFGRPVVSTGSTTEGENDTELLETAETKADTELVEVPAGGVVFGILYGSK